MLNEIKQYIKNASAMFGASPSNVACAVEPIKGQAWASPIEQVSRFPRAKSLISDSQSDVSDALASSQFAPAPELQPGQHISDDSTLSRLRSDPGSPLTQPYSRTPELRVSPKLVELQRRLEMEMEELSDQLRDLMPQEKGSKASKWEILAKGMSG